MCIRGGRSKGEGKEIKDEELLWHDYPDWNSYSSESH